MNLFLSSRRTVVSYLTMVILGFAAGLASPASAVEHDDFLPVSLIALIANPEKFDGKPIRIEGIALFDNKTHMYSIFLTREDRRVGNGLNGIFLILAASLGNIDRFNNKHVVVRGVFQAENKGHLSSFSGTLADVDWVRPITIKL